MATISIQRVENLIITPEAIEQLAIGATPESLRDAGYTIPEGMSEAPARDDLPTSREEEEIMLARAELATPPDPSIKPFVRKAHLLKAMQTAAKLRMYRGGVTTSQETGIYDMDTVEDRLGSAEGRLKDSLAKACGTCAFKDQCRLEGKTDAWLNAHPTKIATNKKQQSLPEFKESLDLDPMAHCIPTRNTHHKRLLARH